MLSRQIRSRRAAKKQEKRLAKEMGGHTTPASGATWNSKGDVLTKRFFVEAKLTSARQYPMKLDVLEKMEQQAFGTGRCPMLILTFSSAQRDFVMLSKEEFENLVGKG